MATNHSATEVFHKTPVFVVGCVFFYLSYLQVEHTGEKLQKTAEEKAKGN